jgi:hypothetical protein
LSSAEQAAAEARGRERTQRLVASIKRHWPNMTEEAIRAELALWGED